jgi:hypothetical protein
MLAAKRPGLGGAVAGVGRSTMRSRGPGLIIGLCSLSLFADFLEDRTRMIEDFAVIRVETDGLMKGIHGLIVPAE